MANSGVGLQIDDGPKGAGSAYYWNDITAVRLGITCGGAAGATGLNVVDQNNNGSNLTLVGGAIVDCGSYNNSLCTGAGTPFACCSGNNAGTCNPSTMMSVSGLLNQQPRSVTLLDTYIESYVGMVGDLVKVNNAHAINLDNVFMNEAGGSATNCLHLTNSDVGQITFTGRASASGICANVVKNDKSGYTTSQLGDISYYFPGTQGTGAVIDGAQAMNGALKPNGSITTLAGATAGNVYWSEPLQGSAFKRTVLNFQGYQNNGSVPQKVTFPASYSYPGATSGSCPSGLSVTTTAVSLPASMSGMFTGQCFIDGQ
jgi:hypothetical protein